MIDARIARFEARVDADVRRRLAEQSDAGHGRADDAAPDPRAGQLHGRDAGRAGGAAPRDPAAGPPAGHPAGDGPAPRARAGQLDFRRTIRASLSSGGVPLTTHHRPKRPLKTDLVVLCDLSESVTSFAHFTLLLVYALREQFTRVRAFAFVDELDEITRFFAPGADVLDVVTRLAARGRRRRAVRPHRLRPRVRPVRPALRRRDRAADVAADPRRRAVELRRPGAARPRPSWPAGPGTRTGSTRSGRAIWDTGDSRAGEYGAVVPMVECRNLAQLSEFVRDLAE